ncbi:hypothetical protein [Fluviibacter phosphoraccumulans]|nr:hypothetical protein [Fluviibacter phosphoraccumulans]
MRGITRRQLAYRLKQGVDWVG